MRLRTPPRRPRRPPAAEDATAPGAATRDGESPEGDARPTPRRPQVRAQLLAQALVAASALYLAALPLRGPGFSIFWDGVVQSGAYALAAATCLVRATGAPRRRLPWLVLGVGLVSYALGWVWRSLVITGVVGAGTAWLGDLLRTVLYVCAVLSLALLARGVGMRSARSFWLDGLIAGFGVGAVITAVGVPWLSDEALVRIPGVDAGYVMADLAVVVLLVVVLVTRRLLAPLSWWLLAVAWSLLGAADTASMGAALGSDDPGQLGQWPDAVRVCAIAIMSWAAGRESDSALGRIGSAWPAVAVPAAAAVVSLGVLLHDAPDGTEAVADLLAALAISLAIGRMALTVVEVQALGHERELAVTDDLTGLRNRRGFYRDAEALMRRVPRVTLLLIDLDGFKEVNDTLGHAAGDHLLGEVSERMVNVARSRPRRSARSARRPHADVLARLGGDEFAVVMPEVARPGGAQAAERLLAVLDTPFTVEGVALRVRASAGLVQAPEDGLELGELLRKADVAMYVAKARRSGLELYRPEIDTLSRTKLGMVERVRSSIAGDELVLHYQPKIDLRTGSMIGVEALARLEDPEQGLQHPAAFLGVVEQAGMMPDLTTRVVDLAVRQVRCWLARGIRLPVAVNIRADAFADHLLPVLVREVLARHDVPAHLLVIEVTEDFLMADRPHARVVIEVLRGLGVQISIDDYGTGYSSLAYLRDLDVDELKLDRAFIADMATDVRAAQIVRSTVELAHSLGMRMVAEGVECPDVARELRGYGCDAAQGYHFARPMSSAELECKLGAGELSAPAVIRSPLA